MTLSPLALLFLRRWYIALFGLVLTGVLAVAAQQLVKPDYDAAGSILLLPPTIPGANPYTDLGAVPGVPEVISRVLHDSKYADKYDAAGIDAYEVSPDQSAGGPAVLVIGKGHTEREALKAMQTVMADVRPTLQELQDEAGVDPPNLITSRQIYVETEATKVGKKQTRAMIAAVGFGLVDTLFLVAAFDALLGRLAARRAQGKRWRRPRQSDGGGDGPPSGGAVPDNDSPAPRPEPARSPESEPARSPESSPVAVRSGRQSKRPSRTGRTVPATDSD